MAESFMLGVFMLRIEGLKAGYGAETILKDISVVFDKKALLLGPNGAGKTTLFRTICGLTKKLSGRVMVGDINIDNVNGVPGLVITNIDEIYRLIYYVDVYHLADMYLDLLGGDMGMFLEVVSKFGLDENFLHKRKLFELSAGQKKIVLNAIALSTKAKVKLFDEPFEQLDPKRKDILIEYLENDENVLIVSTHETWLIKKLNPASWDVAFMFEGKIYGSLPLEKLLNAYLFFGEKPNALLIVKTDTVTFSITMDPVGKPLSDIFSLDYIYKLA